MHLPVDVAIAIASQTACTCLLHICHLNMRAEGMLFLTSVQLELQYAAWRRTMTHRICCAQAGDHVKVNSGQHEGQTGMVVRVEDPVCVLVSDATHEELQVFARDLTESSEAATGLDRSVRQPLKGHNKHKLNPAFQSHTQLNKAKEVLKSV